MPISESEDEGDAVDVVEADEVVVEEVGKYSELP